ncbi:NADP-dependent oxidoreductase domain [Phytophthora cactorum]|nr:NADP-dependent oxidoreductase domain [Phytophthora cactorum]
MLTTTFKHGINFFDSAENYTDGYSEELTGLAIQRGIQNSGFMELSKHIVEGMKRHYVTFSSTTSTWSVCDRSEPYTPIEETVRPMNFVIQQVSGWLQISEACEIADRLGLIRPIVEQSQYSIVDRNKVEFEFVDLYKKYNQDSRRNYSTSRPSDSRFATPMFKDMQLVPSFDERVEMAEKIKMIVAELGCSLPQLALAWCVSNENASTVMIGASRPEQLENLKELDFVDKVTPEVKAKIDAIVNFVPTVPALNSLATLHGRRL